MPELPEVETIKLSLEQEILGEVINRVKVLNPQIIKKPGKKDFACRLTGLCIESIERRGKYLLIRLSGGLVLLIHLRMTGRLFVTSPERELEKHTHLVLVLSEGRELRFKDVRRFGTIYLLEDYELKSVSGFAALGPEPLGGDFTLHLFARILSGRRCKLKQILLNQSLLAGIGNIYADEILFNAGLSPCREAGTLCEEEIARLYGSIRAVLREAIKLRGTSVNDYVDGRGRPGAYQNKLEVYRREGKPCRRCGGKIMRLKISGRSTYYCPQCQS